MKRVPLQRGVTLVELLVTIVLAGIAFAALVPVFVMASQSSSNDRARILATNAAQSTIERLRDLPYDDLYDTDWTDATQAAAILGHGLEWKGSSGSLTVQVVPYPEGSGPGSEKYLLTSVTASWTGQGGQSHEVVMKTAIYKEGLGTETLVLYVSPLTGGVIRQSPVIVTGRLNAADASNTDRIDFTVYANNGTRVDDWSVDSADADVRADGYSYYEHPWITESLADGRYSFVAKTVPLQLDPQPPAEWARKEYVLDRDPPSNQLLGVCQAGFQIPSPGAAPQPYVFLKWSPEVNQSDLDHFEIFRTGKDQDGADLPDVAVNVPNWSMEYVDRDVVEGATYTYFVRGWDTQDQHGEWSPEPKSAVILTPGPVLAPAAPAPFINYTLGGRSVTVAWYPSATPLSVDAYRVYRQGADGRRLLVQTVGADAISSDGRFMFTDPFVDYGATYTYFITALASLAAPPEWESPSLSGAPIRVPEPPKVGMRIDVDAKAGVTVPKLARLVIHNLDNGDMIPANPWDYPTINPSSNNENQNTWSTGDILYPGNYEVMAIFYDQNKTIIATYISEAVNLSQSDTPVHVPYDGPN